MIVYLSLGSNIGNRSKNLLNAIKRIDSISRVVGVSSVYESAPIGVGSEHGYYYNMVVAIATLMSPIELLNSMQTIEKNMGRKDKGLFKPRIIDIDILLYGGYIISMPKLIIPHYRLKYRLFALLPLIEIAPTIREPGTGILYISYIEGLNWQVIKKIGHLDFS